MRSNKHCDCADCTEADKVIEDAKERQKACDHKGFERISLTKFCPWCGAPLEGKP